MIWIFLCRGSCSTAEECLICDEADKTSMTGYRVFDGIELVYNDIEKDTYGIERSDRGRFSEINHCRDGRIEYEADGEFYYLTPGDLSVSRSSCIGRDSYFPLGHYRGISIIVDLEKAPGCLSCVLDDVDVSPDALVKNVLHGPEKFHSPCGGVGGSYLFGALFRA